MAINWAEVAGYIGLALSVGSYLCKDDKKLIAISAISSVAWGLNAYLLGAATHAALSALLFAIGGLRAFELYGAKGFTLKPTPVFAATVAAWAGITAGTWQGFQSVPAAAGIFFLLLSNYKVRRHWLRVCLYAGALSMLVHSYVFSIVPLAISCTLSVLAIAYGHIQFVREEKRAGITSSALPAA